MPGRIRAISRRGSQKGSVYLLSGLKHFITMEIADVVTVMAVTDKEKGPRHLPLLWKGLSPDIL
jgi:alkylation response protein AidB-like acyl-CoA dehydrogenase